jgi:hypothetical protein
MKEERAGSQMDGVKQGIVNNKQDRTECSGLDKRKDRWKSPKSPLI